MTSDLERLLQRFDAMTRMTQEDWRIIDHALAYYGADDLSDLAEDHGYTVDGYSAAVLATQAKVWERMR